MKPEDIIVTDHAKERAEELGIDSDKLINLLRVARPQRENVIREIYKLFKYGKKQTHIKYYYKKGSSRYIPLLFTVKEQGGKFVIITVTKKKLPKKEIRWETGN